MLLSTPHVPYKALLFLLLLLVGCTKEITQPVQNTGSTTYVLEPEVDRVFPLLNYAWKGGVLEIEGRNLEGCGVTINGQPIIDSTGWINDGYLLAFRIPTDLVGDTMNVQVRKGSFVHSFAHAVRDTEPNLAYGTSDTTVSRAHRPRLGFIDAPWVNNATNSANYLNPSNPFEVLLFCGFNNHAYESPDGNTWVSYENINVIAHIDVNDGGVWEEDTYFTTVCSFGVVELIFDNITDDRLIGTRYDGGDGPNFLFLRSTKTGLPVILYSGIPDNLVGIVQEPLC